MLQLLPLPPDSDGDAEADDDAYDGDDGGRC